MFFDVRGLKTDVFVEDAPVQTRFFIRALLSMREQTQSLNAIFSVICNCKHCNVYFNIQIILQFTLDRIG